MESGKVVNGFGPIVNRYNLATNGNFVVNQRNLFTSFTPAKANDYLVDCWYLHSATSVDYVEVSTNGNSGMLRVKGRGKKGQSILIQNSPLPPLGYSVDYADSLRGYSFTSAVDARWGMGVPVQVYTDPFRSSNNVALSQYGAILGPFNRKGTSVSSKTTASDLAGTPYIQINLLGTGDFYVDLYQFRVLCGAFANPPTAVTYYSEDLLRCKRYYQKASINDTVRAVKVTTDWARYYRGTELPVEMAGVPSVSYSTGLVYAHDGVGGISTRTVGSGMQFYASANASSIQWVLEWQETTYSANMINNGVLLQGTAVLTV